MDLNLLTISGYRGILNETFTDKIAAKLARAFGQFAKMHGGQTVLVCRDGRPGGNTYAGLINATLINLGLDVWNVGILPTPLALFAVVNFSLGGAIIISASHNPINYNGLKFVGSNGLFISGDDIKELKSMLQKEQTSERTYSPGENIEAGGSIIKAYQEKLIDSINVDKIKSKKITAVLDPVNGAGGAIAEALLTRIGVRYSTIHRQTDVPFERPAEPIPAHLKKLSEAVLKNKADIGFAQDPDADRLALVDETGRVLSEEYTLALAVKQVLRKTPGSVVVNLSTSSVIEKVTQAADCLLFRVSVGEVNVSKGIVEHGAVVGGEGNGGVIYPKINLARDSFVGIALILELMADTDKRLSELADELPKLVQKKEKVIFGGNLPKVFDMIKASFTDALVDNRDGLRLDWLDGDWVQVRTSNTEPVIRIIAESESEPKVDFILKTVRDIILKYDR